MSRSKGRRFIAYLGLPILLSLTGQGQLFGQVGSPTLTLDEAISIARRNNPEFLIQKNEEVRADWEVRESYAAFLPSATAGGGMNYQGPGVERFGASLANQTRTGYIYSSYSLGLNYRLGGDTFMRPRQASANRAATSAQTEVADFNLIATVTHRYLAVRRAQDGVELARRELERARENQRLVDARVDVGAAIALDAKQAEVEVGRAEVELLRAENVEHTEKLSLIEILGLDLDPSVDLTTDFAIFEPRWTTTELIERAIQRHPQLRAIRATRDASSVSVRMARSQYLPSISLSAGLNGFAQRATNPDAIIEMTQAQLDESRESCIEFNQILENLTTPMPRDCSASNFRLSDRQIAQIRNEHSGVPLSFTRQPFSASLQISLPIFNGLARERQLATARVAEDDAKHRLRAEELRIRREVADAHKNLETAARTVRLEERNRELANDQLRLARERYSVGSASFIELKEAETTMARAERAYLAAVYTFHESLAALEAAVGERLEHQTEERS